ncbi:sporulation membrane protein YtrI [Halobacillus sp. Marseille-Q1614]|uniref:sporulation membrane protein YtrI n=1 Tax=Halobacillus sp. Marseille-Q1614 TaxID=2709134 RepID=UPI00156F2836|nr:sporulation membrane protein YtrI [Halobacillus sp. Marseille-Q1614]
MYLPPQLRTKEWRRFFAGCALGMITGYILFVFINDQLHEHLEEENIQLSTELNELETKYDHLLNAEKEEDEQRNEALTIQEISPSFTNTKALQIDKLTQHELSFMVRKQLESITGESIEEIADHSELILSAIEGKPFVIEDFTYKLEVVQLIISNRVDLKLKISIES